MPAWPGISAGGHRQDSQRQDRRSPQHRCRRASDSGRRSSRLAVEERPESSDRVLDSDRRHGGSPGASWSGRVHAGRPAGCRSCSSAAAGSGERHLENAAVAGVRGGDEGATRRFAQSRPDGGAEPTPRPSFLAEFMTGCDQLGPRRHRRYRLGGERSRGKTSAPRGTGWRRPFTGCWTASARVRVATHQGNGDGTFTRTFRNK